MGPYDDTNGRYTPDEEFERGHWYRDEQGMLYIVPCGQAEIAGPDNETSDKLNNVYREQGFDKVDPCDLARELMLDYVWDSFKRFSPDVGYFSV